MPSRPPGGNLQKLAAKHTACYRNFGDSPAKTQIRPQCHAEPPPKTGNEGSIGVMEGRRPSGRLHQVIRAYHPIASTEVALEVDDVLEEDPDHSAPSGWLFGRNRRTNCKGYFPCNFTKEIVERSWTPQTPTLTPPVALPRKLSSSVSPFSLSESVSQSSTYDYEALSSERCKDEGVIYGKFLCSSMDSLYSRSQDIRESKGGESHHVIDWEKGLFFLTPVLCRHCEYQFKLLHCIRNGPAPSSRLGIMCF
ncbi:Hypothetical predicted protein [Cloeon dipterum]|uniref:SH3 domain-containing protein n=1 Tax=Cloeon dipterum TaxID=197152 RepID=A0A8S1DAL9_9INSE|nr:Hypothetical predicted protein [Cloeon dipterum]